MSKNLSGPFAARSLGTEAWLFTTGAAGGPEVVLQGAGPGSAFLADAVFDKLAVNWRDDGVELILTASTGVRALRAASAIVHEPAMRLYESLPLAGFDAEARQFWRRVFRLIRIPGGRHLLGFIARRKRGRAAR
jgi:hypothetical protein